MCAILLKFGHDNYLLKIISWWGGSKHEVLFFIFQCLVGDGFVGYRHFGQLVLKVCIALFDTHKVLRKDN